jgi:F-type H+-transporting ATPase subunit alpha
MKSVAGTLRLDLAQYREKAAFAQFGSDLDKATQAQLARGERLMELLKQPQYKPMSVTDQVISIFAATSGGIDDIPVADITRFESEFLAFMRSRHNELRSRIESSKQLNDADREQLSAALNEFKASFTA